MFHPFTELQNVTDEAVNFGLKDLICVKYLTFSIYQRVSQNHLENRMRSQESPQIWVAVPDCRLDHLKI